MITWALKSTQRLGHYPWLWLRLTLNNERLNDDLLKAVTTESGSEWFPANNSTPWIKMFMNVCFGQWNWNTERVNAGQRVMSEWCCSMKWGLLSDVSVPRIEVQAASDVQLTDVDQCLAVQYSESALDSLDRADQQNMTSMFGVTHTKYCYAFSRFFLFFSCNWFLPFFLGFVLTSSF